MPDLVSADLAPMLAGERQPTIEIRIASSFDDLMKVVAIRALVYCGEQSCPYDEEFDGNDLTATHLIGFVDGEPAATIRLRYFGDFAKHERTTVRREFRGTGIGREIIRHSLDFLRRKGFRTVYGHAAADLGDYWRRIGWQACGDAFRFSGHDFLPMTRDLGPPAQQPFGIDTDPLVLNRPEGQWDQPGILDFSASR